MKYVALLRGIAPMNPNMRNEKLRGVFASLGFKNVQTVISSGNVLFESPSKDVKTLEATVEKAIPEQLGFTSTTIIRSQEELQQIVEKNPFKGREHSPKSSLNITFLKNKSKVGLRFPYHPDNRDYVLLGLYDRAIASTIDLTSAKTPDLMSWLEKEFGKEITTRTWKTVMRLLNKLEDQ